MGFIVSLWIRLYTNDGARADGIFDDIVGIISNDDDRDVVQLIVPKQIIPLDDPSDMINLKCMVPKNIDRRGMLFERVPLTIQDS